MTPTDRADRALAARRWDDQPMIVVWEITRACELICRHCRASAIRRRDPEELSTEEGERFLDQVARAAPKIFILTGGDPMSRPDLAHLVGYASSLGLRVALSPSATPRLLASDLVALREAGLRRVSLSLDAATREGHDRFRGVEGAWDWTMQAFEKIRAAGLTIQINTTITRHNRSELGAFADLLLKLKPEVWSVFQLVPTGRARRDDLMTADEMETFFTDLCLLSKRLPFPVKTTEGQHYRRVAIQHWRRSGSDAARPAFSGLNDGRGFVFVSHTGEVCPSGFLPLVAGNVRQTELIALYRGSPLFRALRDPDRFRGKCGRCVYRELCGGSRARAYGMTGDYLASDPLCAYEPGADPEAPVDDPREMASDARPVLPEIV